MKKLTSQEFFEAALEMTGLNQSELAEAMGWQRQRISAYLKGRNDPNMRRIKEVCTMLLQVGVKKEALCKLLERLFLVRN